MVSLLPDLQHILIHTKDVWPFLRDKHLFITGGTGFFGRWLLESLVHANITQNLNIQITVLTRNSEAFQTKAPHLFNYSFLKYLAGDIQNFTFPERSIDYIIHAATEANAQLNAESPLLMTDTIVAGTRRVLDLARKKQVKSLLLTSSGAIYGLQPPELKHLFEDYLGGPDITNPFWTYGESKRMAELLSAIYFKQFNIPIKIARCFAFVGPFLPLDTHFAAGNFILNGLNQQPIIIKGDGTPYRSYLYAADLVIWLLRILIHGQAGKPYNVGSDEEISIAELANLVAQQFQPVLEPQILTKPQPQLAPERYVPSVQRAKEELNLKIVISLEESIKRTINFYGKE
ncbi:NAD-dependent epimerase/dehydratase family protein [Adhaeribacter radiodurans]|uniref:NAD-dependent epimerase/dehydratase family protein n=1 Tax=Adhaeribacter radiodurans TaxID=2745197 RepID=A0A7L7L8X0_9BACT|nr:NAD-dependent epimerase/dehydratase family protein [Adhaeribacter radiodurans]QMU28965.1 NAD-dependent epimerase/dehydratase family protein [Adhaeribacter radiodurans]